MPKFSGRPDGDICTSLRSIQPLTERFLLIYNVHKIHANENEIIELFYSSVEGRVLALSCKCD